MREKNIKAKRLRRNGFVPASIYGRHLKESILIQIPQTDVNQFLNKVLRGDRLTIQVGNEKYNVIFKNITQEAVSQKVEQIEFQHIVADEAVNSVITVALVNSDKNENLIQQHVEEITYNALPKDFVSEVVIDLDGMKAGTVIKIQDLDIAKNENIRITMPEDTVILTITENKRRAVEEQAEDEE